MRLRVDSARCQGHLQCLMNSPELFGSDDEGFAVVVHEVIDESEEPAARSAVLGCPESAISVHP
jgi:ferredoxin